MLKRMPWFVKTVSFDVNFAPANLLRGDSKVCNV